MLDVHGCVNVLHVLWLVVVLNTTASASAKRPSEIQQISGAYDE